MYGGGTVCWADELYSTHGTAVHDGGDLALCERCSGRQRQYHSVPIYGLERRSRHA